MSTRRLVNVGTVWSIDAAKLIRENDWKYLQRIGIFRIFTDAPCLFSLHARWYLLEALPQRDIHLHNVFLSHKSEEGDTISIGNVRLVSHWSKDGGYSWKREESRKISRKDEKKCHGGTRHPCARRERRSTHRRDVMVRFSVSQSRGKVKLSRAINIANTVTAQIHSLYDELRVRVDTRAFPLTTACP